jgi:hypothetical protein
MAAPNGRDRLALGPRGQSQPDERTGRRLGQLLLQLGVHEEDLAQLQHRQSLDRSGVTYLLTPNVQFDWRAGLGLNDAADRFFTGCGLTVRR